MPVLLMTGTIQPQPGARELSRVNVDDRIADYRKGLAFNMDLLRSGDISELVFVENSGAGMSAFEPDVHASGLEDRIELISYDANQPEGETRFLGECKLLQHAFATSRLIRDSIAEQVWKVTGRYIVRNLGTILRKSDPKGDMSVHCRDYPMRFVDFGIAGFRRETASTILHRILDRVSGRAVDERIIRDMMDDGSFQDMTVRPRLARVPNFIGVRGVDNASYGGLRYRLLYHARSMTNAVLPSVWI